MSTAAKRTLGGSIALTIVTIIGVHYAQKVESLNMYQGVIKDQLRREQRALDKASGNTSGPNSSLTTLAWDPSSSSSPSSPPLLSPPSPNSPPSSLGMSASSSVPTSIRGFDAPVAPGVGERTDEQKARDRRERQLDFERSQERNKRLMREQGVVGGEGSE